MKILMCCEFYYPSIGGVQEVMRQLAERFVQFGHDVTVATSFLSNRSSDVIHGVKIASFHVSGNDVRGLCGEINEYQEFLKSFEPDVLIIKAAQQWTFDAAVPVIADLNCQKILIPCGFSALYEEGYADYFARMGETIKLFDHLIFYASDYRDINFARSAGAQNLSIIPNAACEKAFSATADRQFREYLGIGPNDLLLMSVGAPIANKGHAEVAEAFRALRSREQSMTLVLNGDWDRSVVGTAKTELPARTPVGSAFSLALTLGRKTVASLKHGGLKATLRRIRASVAGLWRGAADAHPKDARQRVFAVCQMLKSVPGKRILLTDLSREMLIQLFRHADLFVFASRVEYSPLVLFEAAAAGTPFISVPVGNAAEIAEWTGAGLICPAHHDDRGYIVADPSRLAEVIDELLDDPARRSELGARGRRMWLEQFNWGLVARRYEAIFQQVDPCGGAASGD